MTHVHTNEIWYVEEGNPHYTRDVAVIAKEARKLFSIPEEVGVTVETVPTSLEPMRAKVSWIRGYGPVEGEKEYRIGIHRDFIPVNPGEWDNAVQLVMPDRGSKRWTYMEPMDYLRCGECGEYPEDHPDPDDEETTEDEWDYLGWEPHPWTKDPDVAAFVLWDTRGPDTEVGLLTDEEAKRMGQPAVWRDVQIGAFVIADRDEWDNPSEEWLSSIGKTKDEWHASYLESMVNQWGQWASGDVWGIEVASRTVTACDVCGAGGGEDEYWGDEESVWGFYGSENLREYLRGDFGLSDDEIQDAIDKGNLVGEARWAL